jgi:hypothetical protein
VHQHHAWRLHTRTAEADSCCSKLPAQECLWECHPVVKLSTCNTPAFTEAWCPCPCLSTHQRSCLLACLTLRRNGVKQWFLKNSSFLRIPKTYDYQDVGIIPDKTDIKAGAAWIHLTDTP